MTLRELRRAHELTQTAIAERLRIKQASVARIEQMWTEQLAHSGGPMLFGAFSAADAFYAPVCMRLHTYALPLGAPAAAYVQRVRQAPGVKAWIDAALAEQDFLDFEEPYRKARS